MTRIRSAFALFLCASLATVLVACGSDEEVTADADPQDVIDRTFGPEGAIESAVIDARLEIEQEGPEGGFLTIEAGGPVAEAQGDMADMDLNISLQGDFSGEDIDFSTGIVSVDEEVYLRLDGEAYRFDDAFLGQMQAEAEGLRPEEDETDENGAGLFGDLEIPQMLTDLSNQGTVEVEGTETVHVSGVVDVSRAVAEIEDVIGAAGTLGDLGLDVPGADDLSEVEETVGNVNFDIYSGTDDGLLRRIEFTMPVDAEEGSGTLSGSVTLSDVNEPQEIEAPEDAREFMELFGALADGALEGLGIEGLEDFGDFGFGPPQGDGGDGAPEGGEFDPNEMLDDLEGALDQIPDEVLDQIPDDAQEHLPEGFLD